VIERDATTLWHALSEQGRDDTLVDLASVDDEDCVRVIELFEAASVKVGVWEITSNVGIPAFRCVILDGQPALSRPHLPGVGAGCHPCRAVALVRALTEAAQTRITLISGSRDDLGVAFYVRAADTRVHDRTLVRIDPSKAKRSFRVAPDLVNDSLDADVRVQLDGLKRAGIHEAVVIDLSKPEIGVPVVRVVVPGLEGIHEAPGYLGGDRYQRNLSVRCP
jgi:ribosomal protein S12 methylthiotransferase accessory factor